MPSTLAVRPGRRIQAVVSWPLFHTVLQTITIKITIKIVIKDQAAGSAADAPQPPTTPSLPIQLSTTNNLTGSAANDPQQ